MSDFVNKPGLGTIFPNRDKKEDRHPDIKGSLTLDTGEVVNFAGWKKADKNDKTYYSLKIDKPRDSERRETIGGPGGGGGREAQREPERREAYDLDDEIPFARNDGLR